MIKFPDYFEAYGGLNALVKSKYFWLATILTVFLSRYFTTPNWWALATSILPDLVGFSIAGVAIFVSLSSDSLRSFIAGSKPEENHDSPFMTFMAMFTHFLVIQLLALLFAIVAQALYEARPALNNPLSGLADDLRNPFWLLGGFLFCYAISLCIALSIEIYRLARIIDKIQTHQNVIGKKRD
mgnify:CR=1 FL=1